MAEILELTDLHKVFPGRTKRSASVHAVQGVSLSIGPGRTFGLVGETGCGKSTIARLSLGLLEPSRGTVRVCDRDLSTLRRNELREMRAEMQMVFQDPYASLNPRRTIRQSLHAAFEVHGQSGGAIRTIVDELAETVGLSRAQLERYPRGLSGGQRQRAGIARALALEPKLIVCDEPVSALDVSIQAQILNLLRDLQSKSDLTFLFISHDLRVVRHMADEIGVMYLGHMVEVGSADVVYRSPAHPYTRALLSAVPDQDEGGEGTGSRIMLTGDVPSPLSPPTGCPFHTRCQRAREIAGDLSEVPAQCRSEMPPVQTLPSGAKVACWFPEGEAETPEKKQVKPREVPR